MTGYALEIGRDHDAFEQVCADRILQGIDRSTLERGRCAIAISGGTTPRAIHDRMVRSPLKDRIVWSRVDFYFADERCVPPDDPESNYGMAADTLFRWLPIEPGRIHRMEGERADRDRAAEEYDRLLPDRLDILVLGMGEEGHTCSLFPGSPAILEARRRVVAVETPAAIRWRITITPPVIAEARTTLVTVDGISKAGAVAAALQSPPDPLRLPIQLAAGATWILDPDAASKLPASLAKKGTTRMAGSERQKS